MYLNRPKFNAARGHLVAGVIHTGNQPEQNFRRGLVEQAIADGWMSLDGSKLTLHAEPEDLHYTVKRSPGYYCKSTGEQIPISTMAWVRILTSGLGDLSRLEVLAWLAANGKAADDYDLTMSYECVLDAKQHKKYRAVRAVSGNPVAAHTIKGA